MSAIAPSVALLARPASVRRSSSRRSVGVRASADKKSYFDLKDLESTTGSWDVYGVQEAKRYPEIQNTFFERAANAVTRRESMYSFLTLTGAASLLLWGSEGAKEFKLPITVGPQAKPPLGPRDKL